jgi:signal transduction histidine kinase
MESPYYAARRIRIEQQVPATLPLVNADGERLKQALLNLCKNAVEAMPQGGTLTLRAQASKDEIVLEIVDTGTGIPAEIDIFEAFITTKPKGSGLGLPIVHQIIAAHKGTISYTSDPGKGTVFRLTLPLALS